MTFADARVQPRPEARRGTTALASRLAVVAPLLSLLLAQTGRCAEQPRAPNIVVILADDLGYSDLGCYGSEILTPNLDQMAKDGLRFTQFYNAGQCCPTRAALLTGRYPHQVAMGHMTRDFQRPGYRGNLKIESATLAELLRAKGYQTRMFGKWHLTRFIGPKGPSHTWPRERGFDQFYGTIAGWGSYFDPATLCRQNEFTPAVGDFYYTDAIAAQAAESILQASKAPQPYFLYVAFTAPHWPLHARPADLARYRGKYAAGWDIIRDARLKRMVELGVIRPEWTPTRRDSRVLPWPDTPNREWFQRRMEVYAAQVDALDQAVGRVLAAVTQSGRSDNTLVMFLSDNGASAEELSPQWQDPSVPPKTRDGRQVQVGNNIKFLPGGDDTFQSYGVPWANVSNTPFRLYKRSVHEGGIAGPMIVQWPERIRGGRLTHQVGHVIDLVPTCLAAAELDYPKTLRGYTLQPLEGTSLLPIFRGETLFRGMIFWEHEGNRAVRDGKWKLVSKHPGPWELYDMEADRTETQDLAAKFPTIVNYMSKAYDGWAKRVGVEPWLGK